MRNLLGSLTRSQVAGFGIQALFCVIVPLLMLPLALKSILLAGFFAVGLILLMGTAFLGIDRAGSVLIVLAVATAPLDDLRPVAAVGFVSFSDLLFAVGFLLLIPRLAGTALRLPVVFIVGALGVIAVGVLSSIGVEQMGESFNHLARFAVGALGLTVLLVWWSPNRNWTIATASAYLVGNAVNVIASYLKGPTGEGRYWGLTTHGNVMGLCAAIGFGMTPFLLYAVPRQYRWLVVLGSAFSFWGIWISGSRAALAAVLVLMALYPLLTRSIYSALAVAAFGFASVYVVDWVSRHADGSNALERLLGGGSARGSDEEREALAEMAIDQFWEHPVMGGGLANVMAAHSIYLQILAAIGVVGIAFFIAVLGSMVRPLILVRRPYGFLAAPALTYAMAGLVSPLLWDRYIWCALSLALMASRLAREDDPAEPDPDTPPDAEAPPPEPGATLRPEGVGGRP